MPSVPSFGYSVDSVGAIRTASDGLLGPAGHIVIDGVQNTTWLGPFAPCERDLLRVFSAILDVDRLSPRRAPQNRRGMRDLIWQRHIDIQIAVEDPARWATTSTSLATLLSFMTDDTWNVSFVGARTPSEQQQLMPSLKIREADEVALFSGGLDSVLGMDVRSREARRRFVAVSAYGNEVRGRAQNLALARLRQEGVEIESLKFAHQIRGSQRRRREVESSQRTRGIFFLALGAAVASCLQRPYFAIYETGVGCINIPVCSAQVGAQSTRAMHPRTLMTFNELLGAVVDEPPRAIAPFFLRTKGELCRATERRLEGFVRVTNSCDEGDGHKLNPTEHCGVCTSCLFRRVALHAAGSGDPSVYRDRVMQKHGVYEQRAFESHARDLLRCATFDDLLQIDPNVRFSRHVPIVDPPTQDAAEAAVLSMYRRYAEEVEMFFAQARPGLHPPEPRRRKEKDRDLFAAIG